MFNCNVTVLHTILCCCWCIINRDRCLSLGSVSLYVMFVWVLWRAFVDRIVAHAQIRALCVYIRHRIWLRCHSLARFVHCIYHASWFVNDLIELKKCNTKNVVDFVLSPCSLVSFPSNTCLLNIITYRSWWKNEGIKSGKSSIEFSCSAC